MSLFKTAPVPSMEDLYDEMLTVPNHQLVDVRSPQEFQEGHLAGSRNIPLNQIPLILKEFPQKDTPLYLYCHSGARSQRACAFLNKQGYTHVTNLGGLIQWHGPLAND